MTVLINGNANENYNKTKCVLTDDILNRAYRDHHAKIHRDSLY